MDATAYASFTQWDRECTDMLEGIRWKAGQRLLVEGIWLWQACAFDGEWSRIVFWHRRNTSFDFRLHEPSLNCSKGYSNGKKQSFPRFPGATGIIPTTSVISNTSNTQLR
ncbi:unnamed protein product [Cuscuta epithymum]|uniref:Uncharacterized protein n=1 Tax=Cuscuta epithymum TaxID=186058 RepID=A0AAV0DNK6_9ASTE|nr:unnamed protein product [Cuscuta epithymum]